MQEITMRLTNTLKSWLAIGIIVSSLATLQGCSSDGSFSQLIDDETITLDITAGLNDSDKQLLLNNNLHILTNGRKVLLSGQVRTADERTKIVNIAAKTASVEQVYNQIRLGPPITFERASKDSWLTTKVKTSIINLKGIEPLKVKVITENAEVFLIGKVTQDEGDRLAEAARYVVGVDKVIKVFEYR
ncbi:BON domain-containing protein [Moritella marina ATCC 15381]|uniref:BON domain-containing protein n=1 Tax=Moritella marina ATCC 15381 TaxID=1202962 RepID=A0A5J6WRC0_MORMI|nr:BON domain-containing protein [Moritella marina]QFI39778.1 BON domain-containing protein [Moritella marina ATCC 15381]